MLDLAAARKICEGATDEEWRPLPWNEHYQISSFGFVRSCLKRGNHKRKVGQDWRLLSLSNLNGYKQVSVPDRNNIHYQQFRVHRLVMEVFVGPCPEGMEVAHLNGVRDDNRVVNLKYCTPKENNSHKVEHGTNGEGEENSFAKYPAWQIQEIRHLASKGVTSGKIAALFDMSRPYVAELIRERNWRTLPSDRTALPECLDQLEKLECSLNLACNQLDDRDKWVAELRTENVEQKDEIERLRAHFDNCNAEKIVTQRLEIESLRKEGWKLLAENTSSRKENARLRERLELAEAVCRETINVWNIGAKKELNEFSFDELDQRLQAWRAAEGEK